MMNELNDQRKIAVIGLGYVGLPVACAFATIQPVIGYDKNTLRITELKEGYDRTKEMTRSELLAANLLFTDDPEDLHQANFYIIAVPTPINRSKHPDLSILLSASQVVGKYLSSGDIVVYESTVYPGATEHQCLPVLESVSGLQGGKDFKVGYSPERINPGDKEHSFTKITKVVSGQDQETLDIVAHVYGAVITAGIYCAPSIKVAEAAKVIENTQRDLNIALMNELAIIFDRMDIDTQEVLAAAATKWNFLNFKPGLVGGHCIGVDPYYLTYQAERFGYQPEVILSGRRINDNVGTYIAQQTIKKMIHAGYTIKDARVGILGFTFKENCPDIRNTKVVDIINELEDYGISCFVHDPIADKQAAKTKYNIDILPWDDICDLDTIIVAVAHDQFKQFSIDDYHTRLRHNSILIDIKGIINAHECQKQGIELWKL